MRLLFCILLVCACATDGKTDRLRQVYLQSGIRADADFDCEDISAEQCQCAAREYAQLSEDPDDQSLLQAEQLMRSGGLGRVGSGGLQNMTYAISVAPMLIMRDKERCGIGGSVSDAWDATSGLTVGERAPNDPDRAVED